MKYLLSIVIYVIQILGYAICFYIFKSKLGIDVTLALFFLFVVDKALDYSYNRLNKKEEVKKEDE